jgi:AraC-like DNA-binding protein
LSRIGDGFCVRSLAETHFAGGHIPRHDHAWGQLVYAASGVMHVITNATVWLVPPTRAIWLPPRLAHEVVMKGEVALRTLYIDPEWAQPLPLVERALEVAPLLRELILHILGVGMLDAKRPEHTRLAGLLIDLMVQARPEDLSLRMPSDHRALALARKLRDAPVLRDGLSTLAIGSGASLRTLQRKFPLETGLTLEAWRAKSRLIHALATLSAGGSVTAAAFDSGHASLSAFITAFRRQFGTTPGRYRVHA